MPTTTTTTTTTTVPPPARPEVSLTADPTTAELGAAVTVRGANWPCGGVIITPQRSSPLTVDASRGAFTQTIPIPQDAPFGPYSIAAACERPRQITAAVTIEIVRVEAEVTTTTSSRGGPPGEVDDRASELAGPPPAPAPPTASPPADAVDGALALSALTLAIAVATFVLHRRARRSRHPAEPHLEVRVVDDAAPSISLHRTDVPAVRVRLFGGAPLFRIRETPS